VVDRAITAFVAMVRIPLMPVQYQFNDVLDTFIESSEAGNGGRLSTLQMLRRRSLGARRLHWGSALL